MVYFVVINRVYPVLWFLPLPPRFSRHGAVTVFVWFICSVCFVCVFCFVCSICSYSVCSGNVTGLPPYCPRSQTTPHQRSSILLPAISLWHRVDVSTFIFLIFIPDRLQSAPDRIVTERPGSQSLALVVALWYLPGHIVLLLYRPQRLTPRVKACRTHIWLSTGTLAFSLACFS